MNLAYPAFIIADTHHVFCTGFKELLQQHFINCTITHVANADCLLQAAQQQAVDLVLIDACLPPHDGFTAACQLVQLKAACRMVLYAHENSEQTMVKAFASGAAAYFYAQEPVEAILFKLTETLKNGYCIRPENIKAYRTAQEHLLMPLPKGKLLTATEKKVLQYVAQGLTNSQIAGLLYRSTRTIDNHRQHIMKKAGCHNAVQLLAYARAKGWI